MEANRPGLQGRRLLATLLVSSFLATATCYAEVEYTSARSKEASLAYRASPFSELSIDYFARFSRDPRVVPSDEEMVIGATWRILLPSDARPLTVLMAGHLRDFLNQSMGLSVSVEKRSPAALSQHMDQAVTLLEIGADDPSMPQESFRITAEATRILIEGKSSDGLRSGVVKLVSLIGLGQAPILRRGQQVHEPRVPLRVGKISWMGSYRDLVFMGYNGVVLSGDESKGSFQPITNPAFSIYALSTSDTLPELNALRQPDAIAALNRYAKGARTYGLKFYVWLRLRPVFEKDHPVFLAHPDTLGAHIYDDNSWYQKPGKYILCTESPLVRRYISETITGLFKNLPGLSGIGVIIGGEHFHHCFMRPYAAEKGHTNCHRCERLGPDTVVANLCNRMADAAREVNPDAEVFAWPYSAAHVWSIGDPAQLGFVGKLRPGVALFCDSVKDDILVKPGGIRKILWDYSIDLAGPGLLARQRLKACHDRALPIHFKSEPELSFEAAKLPGLPCMDRWAGRADALASSSADGVWVFPWFVPCLGAGSAEVFGHFWWQPALEPEEFLRRFADRIAGRQAGPHLRKAWRDASQAMDYSPEIGPYFRGVNFLGPAHPMCANPAAPLPEQFETVGGASFVLPPTGNVPVFAQCYRNMAARLASAADEINLAEKSVSTKNRVAFDAEASSLNWFYHTIRSTANYYESCLLRDRLLAFSNEPDKPREMVAEAEDVYSRWRKVLLDERENTIAAIPVMAADMRLDFYYGFGGVVAPGRFHGVDMMRKKLEILESELSQFLPELATRCGVALNSFKPESP